MVVVLLSCLLAGGLVAQDVQDQNPDNLAAPSGIDESGFYDIVDVPVDPAIFLEAVSFLELDDGRIVIGTRRGEVYFVEGALDPYPDPEYTLFASGLQEIFGLAWRDDTLYLTQQSEVTRVIDKNGDGRADRFESVSDAWGFGAEHEFTFGSEFDRDGNIWVVCCLSGSYTSDHRFRGWCLRINADGTVTPTASGIRSPGGVEVEVDGETFYTESQGPWNGSCSLRHLRRGGFMGHPISFTWYDLAPNLGPAPAQPTGGNAARRHIDEKRIPELVPTTVVFPYKKTCQSASAIEIDRSGGKFGPFTGQMFVTDYTLSLVMRVTIEKVNGVYQGAVYPFREGFRTGLLGAVLTKSGQLLVGGCSRGWPTRGPEPFALQRLDWSGKVPFEVHEMRASAGGFTLTFTKPVDPAAAGAPASYRMSAYTHHYRAAYGSPEIDRSTPTITKAVIAADGKTVELSVADRVPGHVHELHLGGVRAASGEAVLHPVAYYTLNEIPRADTPR